MWTIILRAKDSKPTITKIPLENGTLEITDQKIRVYDSEKLLSSINLYHLHAITPVNENGIRIHYVNEIETNSIGCQILECKLGESERSSIDICRDLSREITRIKDVVPNDRGWLYLQDGEDVLATYDNISIDGKLGTLYITNSRIVYETKFEIPIDIRYEQVIMIKDHEKDTITVQCDYPLPTFDSNIPSFDIVLPKNIDRDTVYLLIREVFMTFDLKGSNFSKFIKCYSELEYDKLYDLAKDRDRDFYKYLENTAKTIFGKSTIHYLGLDIKILLACKLHGWNIDLISNMTDEEMKERVYFNRYLELVRFREEDLEQYNKKIKLIEDTKTSDRNKLEIDLNYLQIKNALDKLAADCELIRTRPSLKNKFNSEVLRHYNKRVMILYREWCKGVPLKDFTDEYNDDWITYLLKRLNTKQGQSPIAQSHITYDKLEEKLIIRNKNRDTLAKFVTPSEINSRYLYNNCWYDRRRKMWYVEDDNLSEFLKSIATHTQDDSEAMFGRRAWGFKRNNVEMYCGFPAVEAMRNGDDEHIDMGHSRKTGQIRRMTSYRITYHILPIIRDIDITSEVIKKFGRILASYEEIEYTISGAGSTTEFTPKMRRCFEELYDLEDIPLNERVRRSVFNIETGLSHSPDVPLGEDFVKPLKTYPDAIYDERFE